MLRYHNPPRYLYPYAYCSDPSAGYLPKSNLRERGCEEDVSTGSSVMSFAYGAYAPWARTEQRK